MFRNDSNESGKWTCIYIAFFQVSVYLKHFTTMVKFTYSYPFIHTKKIDMLDYCNQRTTETVNMEKLTLLEILTPVSS